MQVREIGGDRLENLSLSEASLLKILEVPLFANYRKLPRYYRLCVLTLSVPTCLLAYAHGSNSRHPLPLTFSVIAEKNSLGLPSLELKQQRHPRRVGDADPQVEPGTGERDQVSFLRKRRETKSPAATSKDSERVQPEPETRREGA